LSQSVIRISNVLTLSGVKSDGNQLSRSTSLVVELKQEQDKQEIDLGSTWNFAVGGAIFFN
jgi:hypothetical protein